MTDLEGAVEQLKRRAYELDQRLGGFPEAYAAATAMYEAADALASITRERDAMREGLKPFAVNPHPSYQDGDSFQTYFKVSDVRRAAALVNGEGGE